MPFLILPAEVRLDPAQKVRLGERLCPYAGEVQEIWRSRHHALWGTDLVLADDDVFRARLGDGTADFRIEVQDDALEISTDPLGTLPLWKTPIEGGWMVAAEVKALAALRQVTLLPEASLIEQGPRSAAWSPYEEVQRVPPGMSLRLEANTWTLQGSCHAFDTPRLEQGAEEAWSRRLGQHLQATFREPPAHGVAACISGGIDSSIACALARRQGEVRTYSLGTPYGHEFPSAAALAQALDCPFEEVRIDVEGALRELRHVVQANEIFDGLTAEILLQLSALSRRAAEDGTHLVTGYGADLLFDGMLRHEAYMQATRLSTSEDLLLRTRWTGELAPFYHWAHGVAMDHVFLEPSTIDLALSVPASLCLVDGMEKQVLRRAAVDTGLLAEELAFRPKQALTDGTQANRLLGEALGLEGVGVETYREKSRASLRLLHEALQHP